MSTLRDTVVHNTLSVIEDIVLTDYKYNAVKGSYGLLEYGQSDVDTTIYGKTLTLSATNFALTTTGYQTFTAGSYMNITTGTNLTTTVGGNYANTVTGNYSDTIKGTYTNTTTGTYRVSSTAAALLQSTGAGLTLTAYTTAALSGSIVNLSSGTTMSLMASGKMSLSTAAGCEISGNYVDISGKTYTNLTAIDGDLTLKSTGGNLIASTTSGYAQLKSTYNNSTNGYVDVESAYSYVQLKSSASYALVSAGTYAKISAVSYVNIDGLLTVKSSNYGEDAPTTSSPGNYTGEVYFRIVS